HLSEAKKARFGALVTDTDLRHEKKSDEGYTKRFALTPAGMHKASDLKKQLGATTATATVNSIEYRRLIDPIFDSEAFKLRQQGTEFTLIGRDKFLLAFKLFADAAPFVITGRLNKAASAVDRLNDSAKRTQIENFIKEGRDAFAI